MPRAPVKQPNGKFAVWSSVVDDFIAIDCTLAELVEELTTGSFSVYDLGEIGRAFTKLDLEGRAWRWSPTWPEAIAIIRELHGDKVADARERYDT